MIIVVFLFSIIFSLYLFMGFYVLVMDHKNRLHQLFFITAMWFALANVHGVLVQIAADEITAQFFYKTAVCTAILTFFMTFFLFLYMSHLIKNKLLCFFVSGSPAFVLAGTVFFLKEAVILRKIDNVWFLLDINPAITGYFYFYMITNALYLLGCLVILLLWLKRTKSHREKRQICISMFTYAVSNILSIVHIVFLTHFFKIITHDIPCLNWLYFIIWIGGIFYAIVKYRFLSITPELISRDVIAAIDEAVMVLTPQADILSVNSKAEQLFNTQQTKIKNTALYNVVAEKQLVREKLKQLPDAKSGSIHLALHFALGPQEKVLLNTRFSLIKDRFGDVLGILAIGREVRGMEKLKTIYGVSSREIEVIRHTLTGSTNKQIAALLNITERTVKAHLTSVYNKMGIDNKAQLLNLVLEG